jgi:drug/metabolite transporter (DMT)-like permease
LALKYNTITLMKWMFPLGVVMNLPISITEFTEVDWLHLPWEAVWRMGFVVLFTTFFAYLLNMFALKEVPPTTIGVFTYLQPLIAIIYASITGNDQMDGIKTLAAILVFSGVYLVTRKPKQVVSN